MSIRFRSVHFAAFGVSYARMLTYDYRYLDRYEQAFVHNLLVHLKCGEIDPHYTPTHGHGAVPSAAPPRTSRSRNRRAHP